MSQPQPLQQRILDIVRANQPLRESELHRWLQDVDVITLDVGVRALMRANRLSLNTGYYDLVVVLERGPAPWSPTPPPTAAEEATANLQPPKFECLECHDPLPDDAYRHRKDGSRYETCKHCQAVKMAAGAQKRLKDGDLVTVATNTAASAFAKLARAHTPPPLPVGSPEPPPASSQHPLGQLAHGTQPTSFRPEDREALPAVGAGRTNTPSEHPPVVNPQTVNPSGTAVESMEQAGSAPTSARAIESLPTSPNSPAAGSVAAGPPADPALSTLAQKRAALIDKREQLLRDYEANLKVIIERIEAIDRVTEQVRKLCSEAA